MSIAGNQNPSAVNETYLHTFQDLGLEQLVDFPTQYNPDNTLDLALTNRPSIVQRCVAIPGLSDHAAVLINTKLRPAKSKPSKRKILLWRTKSLFQVQFIVLYQAVGQRYHQTPFPWTEEGFEEVPSNQTPQRPNSPKKLQKAQRTECRKAYHQYLMGILDPDTASPNASTRT